MKFSVIIAVRNGESYIKRAIESVLSQSFDNFELIVVSNNSTDKTNDILNSYDNIKKFVLEDRDYSLSESISYGVRQATGDYVTFLSYDDSYVNDFLYNLNENLDGCDLLCFSYNKIKNNDINLIRLQPTKYVGKEQILNLTNKLYFDNCSYKTFQYIDRNRWTKCFKKSLLDSFIDKYEKTNLNKFEEIIFIFESVLNSNYIKVCDFVGVNYIEHSTSLSRYYKNKDIYLEMKETIKILEDYFKYISKLHNLNPKIFQSLNFDITKHYILIFVRNNNYRNAKKIYKKIINNDKYEKGLKLCNISGLDFKRKLYVFFLKHNMFSLVYLSFKYLVK